MDQIDNVLELTREQAKLCKRKLSAVILRWNKSANASTLTLRTLEQCETQISCKVRFSNYQDNPRVGSPETCFETISQYAEEWRTLARLVRVGDVLEITWNADAWSNQYLKNAHVNKCADVSESYSRIHVDHVSVSIWRKGIRALTFVLGISICPDNSARMVQWGH